MGRATRAPIKTITEILFILLSFSSLQLPTKIIHQKPKARGGASPSSPEVSGDWQRCFSAKKRIKPAKIFVQFEYSESRPK
jgi:hypothetical protein